MAEYITDEHGNEYELVDDDEEEYLDPGERLARIEQFLMQQGQQGDNGEYEDEEEYEDQFEADVEELAGFVRQFEKSRGHPMTQRELDRFVKEYERTPEGESLDLSDGFYTDFSEADQRTGWMAERLQEPPAEGGDEGGEGE